MDYFYSKTQDNDLWLGFKPQYGWVIYDRKLPSNKSAHGEVYWIKCSDWTFFKDKGSNWNYPEYSFVVTYLKDIETNQQKENEEKALSILDEYINKKRNEMDLKYIETIHNNYLEKKGFSPRSVLKATSERRESGCWECKNTVDNKYDYECSTCRWIICSSCGACKQFGCIERKN